MKKQLLLCCFLAMSMIQVIAQKTVVTGKVTDATTGNPLDGVSVVFKGLKGGTSTNAQGSFVLTIPNSSQTLVFSSLGYKSKEVNAENGMNISLEQDKTSTLGDVIVVGYGTQKKASITGAIVNLKQEDLLKRQTASTSSLLQGLAPGLVVQNQSGRPGADGGSLNIRGVNSISFGSGPLVLIDGVVSNTGLDAVDPNAIESISILKDAASTSIYGNRSSNGVILVKTKRATNSGVKMSYNNFLSKQVATAIPKRVSAIDHMEYSNIAERNRTGLATSFLYPQTIIDKYKTTPTNNLDVIDTDWLDLLLQNNGMMQNHNFTVSAGGEKMSLFTSVTYLKQQGLIKNNSFEKYDIRINPDIKLTKKLTLSSVININNSTSIAPAALNPEKIIQQAIGLPAVGGGLYNGSLYGNAGQSNNRNPIAITEAAGNTVGKRNNILTKLSLIYKPIQNIEIEGSWTKETATPKTKSFTKVVDIYQPNIITSTYDKVGVWGESRLSEAFGNTSIKTYLAQATYNGRYKEHGFRVLAGGRAEETFSESVTASRTTFPNPNQPYLSLGTANINNGSSVSEFALASFFTRLNYNYKEKYFLEANGNLEGTSRFISGSDNKWGTFQSVSAGWIFTKEEFLNSISKYINFGKLRFSIGSQGNQNVAGNYPFVADYAVSNYSNPNNGTNTYLNNLTTPGVALLSAYNKDISWETAKQWNIGLDLTVIKNFNITFDYFTKKNENLLIAKPIQSFVGSLNPPFINAGSLENKGWEFTLNYKKRVGKLGVDVTGMISDVKNKILSTPGVPFFDGGSVRTGVGYAINSYYGYKAIGFFNDSNEIKSSPIQFGVPWNPTNAAVGNKPGDVKYADINNDGKIDVNDRDYLGNAFPRLDYSINLNLTYQNFDLGLFGQGVGKRDNYLSGTGAVPFTSPDFAASMLEIQKDFWSPTNTGATFPRLLPSGSGGNNTIASSHWIRSASYFRLKNVILGYTIPNKVLKLAKISTARFYVSGSNLFTITKSWNGFDPEINIANGDFYPLMKTFTAGLNINF